MLKEKSYKRNQGGVYFLVGEGRDQKREAERKSEAFSIKKKSQIDFYGMP